MSLKISAVFVLVIAAVLIEGKAGRTDSRTKRMLTKEEKDRLHQLWNKYGPDYSEYRKTEAEFPCENLPTSPSVPNSVHELRPGDIKVIGAMGDSITAGSGIEASNILMVITQNRGMSWSIEFIFPSRWMDVVVAHCMEGDTFAGTAISRILFGGGETTFEEQITLPNILKKYNKDIYGFATGDGDGDSSRSLFNVAVSGSTSSDLVDQAQELILRMRNDPRVDFENDWKVVTILSGNNDLCQFCNEKDDINREEFFEHVTTALDILHAQLPRTLVNLVEPLNMEIVTELNKGLICSSLHYLLCDCAAFPEDEEAELELVREADQYQNAVEEIALSGRYDTSDDFTVVSQPFFNATYLPRLENGQPDMSYFAPDCFHLSRKGQAAAASALWNNMIEPVFGKRTEWSPGEPIECPSEARPFFYTNKNSGLWVHGLGSQSVAAAAEEGGDDKEKMAPLQPSRQTHTGLSHGAVVAVVAGCGAVVVVVAVVVLVIKRSHRRHSYETI